MKILVKRTHIEIHNYELGDSERLEYFFTIYDKLTHQFYYKGLDYIPNKKILLLPRGLDIYYLENLFGEKAEYDESYDKFGYFNQTLIRYMPRDNIQKEALRFMLGKGEYSVTSDKSQLSINLNTGAGKTYVAIASIVYFAAKAIVIASSVEWLRQWKKCLLEYTDMKTNEIVMMNGLVSIIKLINGIGKNSINTTKVYLVTHSTLRNYGEKYGWNAITVLFKNLQVGIKIYDEAHLNFENITKIDYHTSTYKNYYLTATPARSNEDENDIYKLYFKNIMGIDLFNEDTDPRTKYVAIKYTSCPTPKEIESCKNQYGLDRNRYTDYVVKKENFYLLLHILMDMINKVCGKVLIYIGTNSAILTVYEWLIQTYPEYANDIGVFTSVVKDNKKDQLSKRIILSTTKSAGAAVDIKDLKMIIVLAEPFKSEVLARQTLGRTRDRNTLYIDIVDMGFSYCNTFYKKKKPIFSKYALECSEITLGVDELVEKASAIIDRRSKPLKKVITRL